jgi:hypothetical protein
MGCSDTTEVVERSATAASAQFKVDEQLSLITPLAPADLPAESINTGGVVTGDRFPQALVSPRLALAQVGDDSVRMTFVPGWLRLRNVAAGDGRRGLDLRPGSGDASWSEWAPGEHLGEGSLRGCHW